MDIFKLHRGTAPLLVSVPHDGTRLPADIASRLTDSARRTPDTDWHIARFYAFDRAEDDVSLYPGQNTTGLCPIVQFTGEPLYLKGGEPDEAEVRARVDRYWRPYHEALREELQRIRSRHGRAVLWEGHSIRGEVPFLFDGRLPDLNLGTAGGASCAPGLQARLERILAAQDDYDFVVNGRFKGGHITRYYGDPGNGIDAVQLEISQRIYMDEDSYAYDDPRAARAQALVRRLLEATLQPD